MQMESLVKELPTRTAHLYRSLWQRYVLWVEREEKQHGNGNSDDNDNDNDNDNGQRVPGKLSVALVVGFLLSDVDLAKDGQAVSDAMVWFARAFKFAEIARLQEWMRLVTKVVSFDPHQNQFLLDKLSINLWNPATETLQSKHFKNCQDKLKLLLDFQWKFKTNLSFEQRAAISLSDLRVTTEGPCSIYHYQDPSFVLIPDFHSPFTCPVFTMAVYYYLRFHGVKKYYKGDGFNILSELDHVPIVRGKSLDQYPRELTLGNWYPVFFKYCQLPYTKKDWFQVNHEWPQFPSSHLDSLPDLDLFAGTPTVFVTKMNRTVFHECPDVDIALFPNDIPDHFKPIFHLLNSVLVRNLPLLYQVFPEHDIFLDPELKTPQCIAYLAGTFEFDPQKEILSLLVDKKNESSHRTNAVDVNVTKIEPNGSLNHELNNNSGFSPDEFKSQMQQLIQLQTSASFSQMINVFLEIFNRLEFKRSNKQFVIDLLNSCKKNINQQIKNTTLSDAQSQWEQDESNVENASFFEPKLKKHKPNYEEELSDEENIEELTQLVNQVITRQFNENLQQQTDRIISTIQPTLRQMVHEEVAQFLNGSSNNTAPNTSNETHELQMETFQMDANSNDIQSIILEWFTPNPECVHTMNKKHGNAWRLNEPNRSLYKMKKPIVQYYIHLINVAKFDKFEAFKRLELLLLEHKSIELLSNYLDSKKGQNYANVT